MTKGGTEVRLERMFGTNATYVLKAKTRRIEPVVAFYAKDLPGAEMERGMNSYRIASHRRDARGYLEGPWAMLYARRLEGDEWEVELQLHQPRESAPESLDP